MRPDGVRILRKSRRAAWKGISRGRRGTHRVETTSPQRGSTWHRRHPGGCPCHAGVVL